MDIEHGRKFKVPMCIAFMSQSIYKEYTLPINITFCFAFWSLLNNINKKKKKVTIYNISRNTSK